jgi:hypothetical protein
MRLDVDGGNVSYSDGRNVVMANRGEKRTPFKHSSATSFSFLVFFSIGCAIPSPMGKLYTRAGRSRQNYAVCHSGGAENNNNLD